MHIRCGNPWSWAHDVRLHIIYIYVYIYKYIYIYIYIYMVFTTEGFFEVVIES